MPPAEQLAFWAAIRANPLDDTPRLVYADWLQENGDEPRAELIRAQCALAKLPKLVARRSPEGRELTARCDELRKTHDVRWAAPFASIVFGGRYLVGPRIDSRVRRWISGLNYARGFVTYLQFDLSQAAQLATSDPPLECFDVLAVNQRPPSHDVEQVAAVARWAGGASVDSFTLTGVTDEDAFTIAGGTWPRLRHLSLTHGTLSDAGVAALAEWPHLATVESLVLDWNIIGPAAAAALADSPHLGRLAFASFANTPIGEVGRTRLAERFRGRVLF